MANTERHAYYSQGQDIHFDMTTPEEETALFVKARAGCEASRTFLIENHLLFARTEAVRLARGALPMDEVISAGNAGIMKAIDLFDHTRGFRFTTYLRSFIRGEIASLWKTKYNSSGVLDPSMTSGYSCPQLDFQVERSKASCFHEVNNLGKNPDRRSPVPSEDHPGEMLDLQQFNRTELAAAIESLRDVEKDLIQKVYVQGMSYADVARSRVPAVSRERVRAQHSEIITKLRAKLTGRVSEVV